MLNTFYRNPPQNSTTACNRCGSQNLFTKIEPPHIALRCRDCGAWQSWVSKARARAINVKPKPSYPQVTESIHPDFNKPSPFSLNSSSTSNLTEPINYQAQINELKKAIDGHDLQLGILIKAILNAGWLQGYKVPQAVSIDDALVTKLVGELAEGGAR